MDQRAHVKPITYLKNRAADLLRFLWGRRER